jgi:hypothetical protein
MITILDTLITSKTRIKLLLKFFLNSKNSAYLRNLETEFGESTNAIRLELNKFEEAGLLTSNLSGNKKLFTANTKHPLFVDIRNILMKYTGLDQIVEHVINKLGDVREVYLTGDLSKGIDSQMIDLVIVGDINKTYLLKLIERVEELIPKKVRYLIFSPSEFEESHKYALNTNHLLLWEKDNKTND